MLLLVSEPKVNPSLWLFSGCLRLRLSPMQRSLKRRHCSNLKKRFASDYHWVKRKRSDIANHKVGVDLVKMSGKYLETRCFCHLLGWPKWCKQHISPTLQIPEQPCSAHSAACGQKHVNNPKDCVAIWENKNIFKELFLRWLHILHRECWIHHWWCDFWWQTESKMDYKTFCVLAPLVEELIFCDDDGQVNERGIMNEREVCVNVWQATMERWKALSFLFGWLEPLKSIEKH